MKFIGDFDGTLEDYITTLPAVTSIGTGRLSITASEVYLYDATNDGNPTISLGSTANERFEIKAQYESGAQGMDVVKFTTYTAGGSANDGRYSFFVDEVNILQIKDDSLNLAANMNLTVGGTTILADSSGTATLSNIDALDATTETTIEQAIDTLSGLTSIGEEGSTTNFVAGDLTMYNAVNNGNPSISLGSSANERGIISAIYDSGAQTLNYLEISTATADTAANAGDIRFTVDEQSILDIDDGGIDLAASKGISINGTDILTDAGGDATLSNIDAIDATTESTIETAIDTLSNLTTVGTIGTGTWQGTAIASAYLDADTMHYSAQRQLTHHMFQDDINTDKIYIGLQETDAESATATNKNLPFLAPVAGKLLKIFVRANSNVSSIDYTWRLELRTTSESTSGTPSGTFGTQSGNGPTNSSMVTYDFTSSLDAGSNAIAVGDTVQLSVQADSDPGGNIKYYVTCLWEWDLS